MTSGRRRSDLARKGWTVYARTSVAVSRRASSAQASTREGGRLVFPSVFLSPVTATNGAWPSKVSADYARPSCKFFRAQRRWVTASASLSRHCTEVSQSMQASVMLCP